MPEPLEPHPHLLFAYGTLGPADAEAERAGGWQADAVRGRLFDLGPYPALVDLDDPSADWVEGHVRLVEQAELVDRLDPYEGVAQGLYRRSITTTRAGRSVWVYVYHRLLPRDARGPIPRWEGRRIAHVPQARRENPDDGFLDHLTDRD